MEEHKRRYPPTPDRRHRRCVRLREVVVGVGGVVCGGIQEVSGIAFYLYAKTYDGCGEGTGG